MNKQDVKESTEKSERGAFYAEWQRLTGALPKFDSMTFDGPGKRSAAVKGSARVVVL